VSDAIDHLAQQPPPAPPPLSAALEAELGKLRPSGTRHPLRQLGILLGISLVYGAGLLAVLAVRRDADELPMGWLVGATLGWLFGFVVPIYFATVPRAGSVTPRWRLAAVSAVVASIGFVAFGLAIHPKGPSKSLELGWDHFLRGHSCLEIGLATALVPVVAGAIFLRGAMPVGSRWIAAALGAGGGALGGLLLHLHCPITDPLHLGLVHGGVVVVAAALAAAIVPRASDVR
jgi:hypothetical protein